MLTTPGEDEGVGQAPQAIDVTQNGEGTNGAENTNVESVKVTESPNTSEETEVDANGVKLNTPQSGTVEKWLVHKGYGFIKPNGGTTNIFVQILGLREKRQDLNIGEKVTFHVEKSRKNGKHMAMNVVGDRSGKSPHRGLENGRGARGGWGRPRGSWGPPRGRGWGGPPPPRRGGFHPYGGPMPNRGGFEGYSRGPYGDRGNPYGGESQGNQWGAEESGGYHQQSSIPPWQKPRGRGGFGRGRGRGDFKPRGRGRGFGRGASPGFYQNY